MNNNGFTLLETLIYSVLLGLILFAVSSFGLLISGINQRNFVMSEVNNSARLAQEIISKEIKEAKSIISPAQGNNSNQLVLENFSGDSETISLAGGIIKINNGQISDITSENVLISNLSFVNLGNSEVDSIKFSYSAVYKNSSSVEFDYSLDLESAATVR
ncbi:prepilin-type N-terminal cleavage/methylation domain-containing protein [Candidatus Parcubacteria bacterium]|nr:prepilin-type N-terminal cleavage/methylation domain-containing protein [Candidatus Parcubacteria bacterium]